MTITFGPEAAYALWRVLVVGPVMVQRRDAMRSTEQRADEPAIIDYSGSGSQSIRVKTAPKPYMSMLRDGSGRRAAATNSDVRRHRDASLYGPSTSKSNDPRWVGLEEAAPDGYPKDVIPTAIREMIVHAENWTINGENSVYKELHEGLGLNTNWRSMPAQVAPAPQAPIDHDGRSSGTNPRKWWDRQPQRETSIKPHRAIGTTGYHWSHGPTTIDKLEDGLRTDQKLAVARGWTPPEQPGGAWIMPEGTSIAKDVTIGHTMRDGYTFGGNLQQERTRKGTPRFTSDVAADPASFGGNVPSPLLFPGKHVRIRYTLQRAWADVGQADRFKVYDTRWSKHVDDPLATGGILITTIPLELLIMDNAVARTASGYKFRHMCSPFFFEEYAPTGNQNKGYASYSNQYVLSHPTRKYPAGRVLGHPTRWGSSHRRTIIMRPVSSTIVAQAAAMVKMGVIG